MNVIRPNPSLEPWLALDFDSLRVGMGLRTPGRTVTEADVVMFLALTSGRCRRRGSSATGVAPEMLLLSYAVGLLPINPRWVIAMRHIRGLAFSPSVPVGATIYADTSVIECRPLDDDTGSVRAILTIVDQGENTLARGELTALWRRRTTGEVSA